MWTLLKYRKKHAISRYLKVLPLTLANGYGKHRYYTPMQVFKIIEKERLSQSFSIYALAIFSNIQLINESKELSINSESFYDAHEELTDILLDSKNKFSVSDVNLFFDSDMKQSNAENKVTSKSVEEFKGQFKIGIDIPRKLTSQHVVIATTDEPVQVLTDFDTGVPDGG